MEGRAADAGLADSLEKMKILSCPVEREKPLAPLSTLGVGGQAECFVEPSSLKDFEALFRFRAERKFPLYILGGGSNVVFQDGPVRGVVLSTKKWNAVSWSADEEGDNVSVEVQTGRGLALLLDETVRRGLGGLEFAAGIPGTVGGAIAGNAGAGGRSIGELLTELVTLESDGSLKKRRRGEFFYSYRSFSLSEGAKTETRGMKKEKEEGEKRLFLSCKMSFCPCPPSEIEAELERFRAMRASQPRGRSAGCTFKNPEGDSAGRLLDLCGCRGMTAGDAIVSEQHANFILNRGHASAKDIMFLVKACREKVFRAAGIRLEPEIKFTGPGFDFSFNGDSAGEQSGICFG